MALLTPIPAAEIVHEVCDYCRRQFVRACGRSAICPSCGLENVRPVSGPRKPPESAMVAPPQEEALPFAAPEQPMLQPAENAMLPPAAPRRRASRRGKAR